jgi:ABC-2 type transport system ATP-binding protein
LDEPTIGLDVIMQKTMRDFIKNYNQKFNSTIILTSHYMDDVKELAKRVIIIDGGQILFDGKLQDIIDQYARNKILTVVFSKDVSARQLAEFSEVKEYAYPSAKLIVPREKAAQKASQLLAKFPVADLTIEEPPIEAIIRDAFTGKMK